MKKQSNRSFVSWLLTLSCSLFTCGAISAPIDGKNGPGVDNRGRPIGVIGVLKNNSDPANPNRGGRMVQYHRGFLYIMGQGKTTLWDVSDATNPRLYSEKDYGDNGHRWWKLDTDIFWREYSVPEIKGKGKHFLDMSDMLNLKEWSNTSVPLPIEEGGESLGKWQALETFPTGTNGGNVHDLRYVGGSDQPHELISNPTININEITSNFDTNNGSEGTLRFRIGNLLFTTTGAGLAVLDIGDPKRVKFLDSITDAGFSQYTTTYHVWRDKVIFLSGNNSNKNGNNLVMIDFSDPANLKHYIWPNGRTGFTSEEVTTGRYMYFQDEYGFMGQDTKGVKINLAEGKVEATFQSGVWPDTFLDYQWMPLGPILVASGSNSDAGRTSIIQHQVLPDLRGPEIAFTSPKAGSSGNPITTVIGFTIPEIIDERTANDQTIQVRAMDGSAPIEGHVTWNSYQVLNFIPKRPLKLNMTYEVKLVEGGLKDVAGNGIKESKFTFATGKNLVVNEPPVIASVSYGSMQPVAVGSTKSFMVSASDKEQDALTYSWDFGDGFTSTLNPVSHAFSTPGVKTVSLRVSDTKGNVVARNINLVVVEPVNSIAPTQSSQLALDASSRLIAAVNPDSNTLSIINADTMMLVSEFSVCARPFNVALDKDKRAWVTCRDDDLVKVISPSDGKLIASFALDYGAAPQGIVANPAGTAMFVSEAGKGQIRKFDTVNLQSVSVLYLGTHPRALAVNSAGDSLFVTRFISPKAKGVVWQVNASTPQLTLKSTIELLNDSYTIDSGSDGSGLPNYLAGISINPTNSRAMVAGVKDNLDRGTFSGSLPPGHDSTLRSMIATIDLRTGLDMFAAPPRQSLPRIDIDDHAQVSAVAYSPSGSHLFAVMQGNNDMVVIDPVDNGKITTVKTGLAPQSLVVDSVTNRVFVYNFMGRSISVFDADSMLNSGSKDLNLLKTLATVRTELLSTPILEGKRIFYNAADPRMGLEGYMSCAACHDDGEADGQVWDFEHRGEGLRNTISLKGRGGMAQGRVHWSANFDEIQDFENDIRKAFKGTGFLTDQDYALTANSLGLKKAGKSADLDKLAAYVSSLTTVGKSPYKSSSGNLTADGLAGKALFVSAKCASCHNGAGFTDSPSGLMHDVGTIKFTSGQRLGEFLLGLDTPTLRGLWSTAPYFHDGSAATLADVLEVPSNAHGQTSNLTAQQKAQLVSYLQQLDDSEPASVGAATAVALTGVVDGAEIRQRSVSLGVETNVTDVTQVDYYVDGEHFTSIVAAPFGFTWMPSLLKDYKIKALVRYNRGKTQTLSPEINIKFLGDSACKVSFAATNVWSDGYQGDVTVTNGTSNNIQGLTLSWQMAPGEQLSNGWNATFTTQGNRVTATLPSNYNLAPGASTSFGFLGLKLANLSVVGPSNYLLNGNIACSIGAAPPAVSANANPVANFVTSIERLRVSFDGSRSSDVNNDPLTFLWDFGDNTTATTMAPSHSYAESGTYEVKLTVSDGRGGSAVKSANLTVTNAPVNRPPVAAFSATSNRLVANFDGTRSSDPDGDALSYTWTFGDNTPSATGAKPSHTYSAIGSYVVRLTVTDSRGATNSITKTINIDNNARLVSCDYGITNEWDTGFAGYIRITNSGTADINGWSVNWNYTDGSQVTSVWGGSWSEAGFPPVYTATPADWNSTIGGGQYVELGLQGDKGVQGQPAPIVAVQGVTCNF